MVLFPSHIALTLTQALPLKYDVLDCLIVIYVIEAPRTVAVKLASAFLSENVTSEYYNIGATVKRLAEQNRQIEALTVLVWLFEKPL